MRLGGSHRCERLATALVVVAVAVASLVAAFHSHPLAIPGVGAPVADAPGERHTAGPAGCWACRLSHDPAPELGVPPAVTGRSDGGAPLVAVAPAADDRPVRGPQAPRAPPVS